VQGWVETLSAAGSEITEGTVNFIVDNVICVSLIQDWNEDAISFACLFFRYYRSTRLAKCDKPAFGCLNFK